MAMLPGSHLLPSVIPGHHLQNTRHAHVKRLRPLQETWLPVPPHIVSARLFPADAHVGLVQPQPFQWQCLDVEVEVWHPQVVGVVLVDRDLKVRALRLQDPARLAHQLGQDRCLLRVRKGIERALVEHQVERAVSEAGHVQSILHKPLHAWPVYVPRPHFVDDGLGYVGVDNVSVSVVVHVLADTRCATAKIQDACRFRSADPDNDILELCIAHNPFVVLFGLIPFVPIRCLPKLDLLRVRFRFGLQLDLAEELLAAARDLLERCRGLALGLRHRAPEHLLQLLQGARLHDGIPSRVIVFGNVCQCSRGQPLEARFALGLEHLRQQRQCTSTHKRISGLATPSSGAPHDGHGSHLGHGGAAG
mmetsp:Transcript_103402/g.205539  ORF Transcript_103402/g.205539 Transcript_103402/m.205539 type:complete len:362 (+) Transcript_103402:268-1353(+)